MSTGLFTFLLFVPFLAVACIVGPMYFRSGYKRGLWRALLSLGATVVATLIALLLANLTAGMLAPSVSKLIPEDAFDSMGIVRGLAKSLIIGMVQDVLSVLLFGFILIIFLIFICIINNRTRCYKEEKYYKN